MSDYNALSQLFRLNPDSPQAHMLSTQELQDDLALWGSVQFQLEPMSDEQLHSQDKAIKSLASAATPGGVDMVSAAESASAWNSFMHIHSQEPLSPQGNPLDFMMGGTTTTDFLSALAAAPITPQQWAQFAQQPPNTPAYASNVPIAPQSLEVVPPANAAKLVADLPAPPPATSMFRYPTLIPKATLPGATATPVVTASTTSTTSRRASAKAKLAATLAPVAAPIDDTAEDEKHDYDDDGQDLEETGDGRQRAASDDKRRRNTAASARFRVKKKLKEQALERTAREMGEKAAALEKRVQELETETRWLKSLIIDKDPNVLSNIRCPCHHPSGLDLSASTSTSAQHSLSHPYHSHGLSNLQPAHQYIVPAPAPSSSSAGEPPLKRSKV
ncbi:hypothetical protein GGI17_005310 [Coemansia sp. S146]|nr:hypothetical protein GGI17_005310 [Coemansia sp. S146]